MITDERRDHDSEALPATPSFRLDGRRALVTGASRGIGLALAVAMAEAGARVTLSARTEADLSSLAARLADAGHDTEVLPLDIADVAATRDAIAAAPPFDVLVNSAGLARHGPAIDTEPGDYDAVMNVNLRGALFLSNAVARRLIEAGRPGSIVHVSSQMGHVGGIDRAVYAASKHGLEGLCKTLAIEWGPKDIRVNTIGPTFVRTALTASTFADPARRDWIERMIKLPRIGEVEDLMGAAVFLASDASRLVTGTSLLVDGGWTAD